MYKEHRIVALIPAGGSGARMRKDVKKQFLTLKGRDIIYWTIKHIIDCAIIDRIVLIVPDEHVFEMEEKLVQWGFYELEHTEIIVVEGSTSRQKSVFNGLKRVDPNTDIVMVHDGVRPFLPKAHLKGYLDTLCSNAQLSGVIAGLEVTDTIKCVDEQHLITHTVDRSDKWTVQTPQIFKYKPLMSAHLQAQKDGVDVTDDAALLERLDEKLMIMQSTSENIKITRPVDLLVAEMILDAYEDK